MNRMMALITMGAAVLLSGILYAQQQSSQPSLGDYARSVKKNKTAPTTAVKQYDNDNLPTDSNLSVVGPAPSQNPTDANATNADATAKADAEAAKADLQKKMDDEKQKVDSLSRELDLEQREYRLRAAAFYADAGNRLRDSGQWDKDDAQYKADIDTKQKAIAAAKDQLDQLQEQARKAGMKQPDETNDQDQKNDQTNKGSDTEKQ